jgi:hypothetical protein
MRVKDERRVGDRWSSFHSEMGSQKNEKKWREKQEEY